MDAESIAAESSARSYVAAGRDGDYRELWRLMSRGTKAVARLVADDQGIPTEDECVMLERLRGADPDDAYEPSDVTVEVVSIVGGVAEVMLSSASLARVETLTFVLEDEEWKLGVKLSNALARDDAVTEQ